MAKRKKAGSSSSETHGNSSSNEDKRLKVVERSQMSSLSNMQAFPGPELPIGARASTRKPLMLSRTRAKPTRKLVIKNAGSSSSSSAAAKEKYLVDMMAALSAALEGILTSKSAPDLSLEQLYRGVENLCRYGKSQALAKLCLDALKTHGELLSPKLIPLAVNVRYHEFMKQVYALWCEWSLKITLIRNIFFYLDRSYLLTARDCSPIWETGVNLFSKCVLRNEAVSSSLMYGLTEILNAARAAKDADLQLVTDICKMYGSFPSDGPVLKQALIESGRFFCESMQISVTPIESFMDVVLNQINIERQMATKIEVDKDVTNQMLLNINKSLVTVRSEEVLNGVGMLVENLSLEAYENLYNICNELALGKDLLQAYRKYLLAQGSRIVATEEKKGVQTVLSLIDFYNKASIIASKSDEEFNNTFRTTFAEFINKDRSGSVAEKLAKYFDELLRNGSKTQTEEEVDQNLNRAILIFRCIQGKDVFEAFYKKDFARRLLQNKVSNMDTERIMIARFKQECGPSFTQRLETMLKDMDLSRDYVVGYKESQGDQPIQFNINILAQGPWPTYPETTVVLPQELVPYRDTFEKFYLSKHEGRKITWQHGLAYCTVKADFPLGAKELNVNLIQSVVLLQFNRVADGESLSFSALQSATQLETATLQRTLQSMMSIKVKVLIKEPDTKEIRPSDVFSVNLEFQDKAYRIKINQLQSKDSQEVKKTQQEVHRDRQMEVQGAIMRIMKARKKLRHVELVQQTIEQTRDRGALDVQDIKKNIEKLLDRDYLAREGDSYIYT
jgi:cullin-4